MGVGNSLVANEVRGEDHYEIRFYYEGADGIRVMLKSPDRGNHYPDLNHPGRAMMDWAEWDRLVAWVNLQRAEQNYQKAQANYENVRRVPNADL